MRNNETFERFLQGSLCADPYSFNLLREAFNVGTKVELGEVRVGEGIRWCVPLSKEILRIPVSKGFVAETDRILRQSELPRRVELCRLKTGRSEKPVVLMGVFPVEVERQDLN